MYSRINMAVMIFHHRPCFTGHWNVTVQWWWLVACDTHSLLGIYCQYTLKIGVKWWLFTYSFCTTLNLLLKAILKTIGIQWLGVNPLHAELFRSNIDMYLLYTPFLHTDMMSTGISNPFSCKTRAYLSYIVSIMAADGLATQGARASAAMVLT